MKSNIFGSISQIMCDHPIQISQNMFCSEMMSMERLGHELAKCFHNITYVWMGVTKNMRAPIDYLYSNAFDKSGPETSPHNFLKFITISVGRDLHSMIPNLSKNFTTYLSCERKITPGLFHTMRCRK